MSRATLNSTPIGRDDRPDTGAAAVQTIVRTAATAPRPETTAPRSVFDIARKVPSKRGGVRVNLPELDPAAIKVETNVPVPAKQRFTPAGQSKYAPLFAALKPGGSVVLPLSYKGAVLCAAVKRSKAGLGKYTVRRVSETEMRIWQHEEPGSKPAA